MDPITMGDIGFITPDQTAGDDCSCEITSPDESVTITTTASGYELVVEHDICKLVSQLQDNGLVIGG